MLVMETDELKDSRSQERDMQRSNKSINHVMEAEKINRLLRAHQFRESTTNVDQV